MENLGVTSLAMKVIN